MQAKTKIKKVAIIGAGTMGAQIAMVCALGNYSVILNDIDEERLTEAKESLKFQMYRRIEKKQMTENELDTAFSKIVFTNDLTAVKDADIVIEAVIEKLDVKKELFSELDALTKPET